MEFPWFRQQFVDPRSWAEAETLPSSSGSTTVANVSLKGDAQAPRNGERPRGSAAVPACRAQVALSTPSGAA